MPCLHHMIKSGKILSGEYIGFPDRLVFYEVGGRISSRWINIDGRRCSYHGWFVVVFVSKVTQISHPNCQVIVWKVQTQEAHIWKSTMKLGNIFSQDWPALVGKKKKKKRAQSTYGDVISIIFSKSNNSLLFYAVLTIEGLQLDWCCRQLDLNCKNSRDFFLFSGTFFKLDGNSSLLNIGRFEMYYIIRIYEERTRHCQIFTKH